MARFLIRKEGNIVGSFPPPHDKEACKKCEDGEDALDYMAKSPRAANLIGGPFASFKDLCKQTGLIRDNYTVEKVED